MKRKCLTNPSDSLTAENAHIAVLFRRALPRQCSTAMKLHITVEFWLSL